MLTGLNFTVLVRIKTVKILILDVWNQVTGEPLSTITVSSHILVLYWDILLALFYDLFSYLTGFFSTNVFYWDTFGITLFGFLFLRAVPGGSWMTVEALSPWVQSEEASSRQSKAFVMLPWWVHQTVPTKNLLQLFKPVWQSSFVSGCGTQTEGKCKCCEGQRAADWR